MRCKLPLPEIPDYVAKHMQELSEAGCDNKMNLRDIGRLFIELSKEYVDEDYIATVEWLSTNHDDFERVRDWFLTIQPSFVRVALYSFIVISSTFIAAPILQNYMQT